MTTELRALAERLKAKRGFAVVTEHGERNQYYPANKPDPDCVKAAEALSTLSTENAELKRQLAEADHAMVRAADVLNHTRGLKVVYDPNDPPTWAYITNEDDEKRVYFYALNDLHLGPSDTGKE